MAAVRAGNDHLVQDLVDHLAACAGPAALHALRDQLAEDLRTARSPVPPDRTTSGRLRPTARP
ncbi:hypothetical protein [Kitasatospora sp. MAP5-34]|uniref:hypothetical protein n=1 Tax=Kitasatospora sp. MAP5-34 TaxID=3035102 RepID=UPI00247397B6|nr:hypothetical protein [Kitasatospora sp. MAP5-34]